MKKWGGEFISYTLPLLYAVAFIGLLGFCHSAEKIDDVLFDPTMQRIEIEMKECIRRQVIYAHNIANKDVEGFKPIRFADELEELRKRPGWSQEKDEVIVEDEMTKMTKNKFRHSTMMRLYNMKIQNLKTAVKQGG